MLEQEIKRNFSKNLILLRKAKGLTQAELADKINYSNKSISKWERGDVLPDIITFRMLAGFFEVSIDELISAPTTPKVIKRGNRFIISLLSCIGVFLCAVLTDRLLSSASIMDHGWMSYIYALSATGVLCVVFSSVWFSLIAKFFSVSYLLWAVGLGLYLSLYLFVGVNLWFIFIACGILQCMAVLGFLLPARRAKLKKNLNDDETN